MEEDDRCTDRQYRGGVTKPQNMPIRPALLMLRCRLTIVLTAMTWSASVAWRIPRKNPRVATVTTSSINLPLSALGSMVRLDRTAGILLTDRRM